MKKETHFRNSKVKNDCYLQSYVGMQVRLNQLLKGETGRRMERKSKEQKIVYERQAIKSHTCKG